VPNFEENIKMKVVLLGNHTVGVRVLQALLDKVEVIGVVAHPMDEEDGVIYESLYDFSITNKIPVIRGAGKNLKTFEFIKELKPDLLWVTDYRYIIPENLINIAPLGAVNIHPSLLPKYRGRASINWAIINGEKEFGLSVHFIDKDVDTGDIIEQIRIPIADDEYIGTVLTKCYPIYYNITSKVIESFKNSSVRRTPQTDKLPAFPRRTAEDGKIDWNQPVNNIYNLIRAVSHPYPGAFTNFKDEKIFIWKALPVITEKYNHLLNGLVIEKGLNTIKVKCNGGFIEISDYSVEEGLNLNFNFKNGDSLREMEEI
jgi:methionyl-tRNA formyltransferase